MGGVIEHPADSHAWNWFGIRPPQRGAGWQAGDLHGGWTCYVEQGHYGHKARKGTWLYACKAQMLPELDWSQGAQRLDPAAIERWGYERARRYGWAALEGGKHKTRNRAATPHLFRDVLLSIAASALVRHEGSV